jgi:predicted ATPase
MITQLKFHNFRILKDATLPLGRVTVIIGPNGSGKSTALEGIRLLATRPSQDPDPWRSVDPKEPTANVEITAESSDLAGTVQFLIQKQARNLFVGSAQNSQHAGNAKILSSLSSARVYALSSDGIAKSSQLQKTLELGASGENLASVLTSLQDQFPERFESLNSELQKWMPEFDRIVLDTVDRNERAFLLRTLAGKHRIPSQHLSQGTLIAVALLTLSHLPSPPAILGLEEIDRGIHPRLLREVADAVNRLAFPENYDDDRQPVQVVMTTHSPYFLDLFRDHPEDIVIAEKDGLSAGFHRLIDMPHYEDILRDSHLGDAWFTGVLGGVPAGT